MGAPLRDQPNTSPFSQSVSTRASKAQADFQLVLREEVETAVAALKKGKSGVDNIPSEHIQADVLTRPVTGFGEKNNDLPLITTLPRKGQPATSDIYGTPEGTFPFRYLSEKKLKQGN